MNTTTVLARLSGGLTVVVLVVALFRVTVASGEPDPAGAWPLAPRPSVVRGFAPPAQAWEPGHRGVDLGGTVGQAVRSALPGRVTMASALAGVPIVVVDHGTVRTTYQPVLATVRVGDQVATGQAIGTLGVTGSHCAASACLHWGLIRNGTDPPEYLDPLALVGLLPVKLLPLAGPAPQRQTRALGGDVTARETPVLLLRPRMGLFERTP